MDIYVYKGTNTLINKLNIRTEQELIDIEAQLFIANGHGGQGQAAKAVVKRCISLWIGLPLSQLDQKDGATGST